MTSSSDVYFDPTTSASMPTRTPCTGGSARRRPSITTNRTTSSRVSQFADVEKGLLDAGRPTSRARGGIIELIKADIEMPPGVIIFEDPPTHTIHRRLLSRAFTPRRVAELEPKIREFCALSLDPLVGPDRFDFIADLGAQMPMQVISMLLGIPESDQEAVRDHVDANLRTKAGEPMEVPRTSSPVRCSRSTSTGGPSTLGRHHDRAVERRVRRRDRHVRKLTRNEVLTYLRCSPARATRPPPA